MEEVQASSLKIPQSHRSGNSTTENNSKALTCEARARENHVVEVYIHGLHSFKYVNMESQGVAE